MGHSHSHSHSHSHNHDSTPAQKSKLQRYRRLSMSLLLSAIVTFFIPLLFRRRSITRTDTVLFCVYTTILTAADSILGKLRQICNRALSIKDGFVKGTFLLRKTARLKLNIKDNAADRVTLIGVVINLFLSVGKASVGVTCHSSALIADAAHSLSDLLSEFITLWAMQIARLPPDDDHPYGYGKFEAVGSLFLSLMLLGTGFEVWSSSQVKLLNVLTSKTTPSNPVVMIPKVGALIMAGLSIVSKEWLYRKTRKVGDDLNSQVIISNAWHHRSDAYSSILSLFSISLAMSIPGMLAADSAAGLVVASLICLTGAEIMAESVNQLTDTADRELVARVREHLLSEVENSDDIVEIKRIRARWSGSGAIVDLAFTAKDSLSSSAIWAVEERLRSRIMEEEERVIDVEVHATARVGMVLEQFSNENGNVGHLEGSRPCQIEKITRDLLLRHEQVKSVEGCTVHYRNLPLANIDANIKLKHSERITVSNAISLAVELRKSLENSDHICKANIFLDLNENYINDNLNKVPMKDDFKDVIM